MEDGKEHHNHGIQLVCMAQSEYSKLNEKIMLPFFPDDGSGFVYSYYISVCSLRCVAAVSFFVLVLFSSQMGGNPFLNFLLQSIVEIPAYIVGKYFGNLFVFILYNICFSFIFPTRMKMKH